jgi:hypothetical protein
VVTCDLKTDGAVGLIRIYRMQNGVHFLASGNAVQALMRVSQCWCLDGESTFALKMGENKYYRIELPHKNDEDRLASHNFKATLANILQYERTPCPFQRGFYVDLPKSPEVVKKPWKAKHKPARLVEQERSSFRTDGAGSTRQNLVSTPDNIDDGSHAEALRGRSSNESIDSAGSSRSAESNKTRGSGKEILDSSNVKTPKRLHESRLTPFSSPNAVLRPQDVAALGFVSVDEGEVLQDPARHETIEHDDAIDEMRIPTRPIPRNVHRSVTAPLMSLRDIYKAEEPVPEDEEEQPNTAETASLVSKSSIDSFQSFHSFHSPLSPYPPSPPESVKGSPTASGDLTLLVQRTRSHKRDISELTITTEKFHSPDPGSAAWFGADDSALELRPVTPEIYQDEFSPAMEQSEERTPRPRLSSKSSVGRRLNSRRAQSPLPSSEVIHRPRNLSTTGNHLTSAILQKSISFLMGPPARLVALMLNLAHRIANDTYTGTDGQFYKGGEALPGAWDYSDNDASMSWDEDDFGIPLGGLRKRKSDKVEERKKDKEKAKAKTRQKHKGKAKAESWEID